MSKTILFTISAFITLGFIIVLLNVQSLPASELLTTLDCTLTKSCTPPNPPAPSPSPPTTPTTPGLPPLPICQNCPKPDCSMVPNGTTFPYANHCKLFYICSDGCATISACSNGYWYDRKALQCKLCKDVTNCEANVD